MIDQHQRLSTVVKDEITKASAKLGIDKSQVGWAVSPSFAPVSQPDGQTGLLYAWVVTITLRVPLLGYPPVLVPVIVPSPLGTLPTDDDFRGATRMGLENANKTYMEVMSDATGVIIQVRTFRGFRPSPPEDYMNKGITNGGWTPDYEGVIFSDGTVVIRWLTAFQSHSVWKDYDTFYAVHGHPEYGTRIEFDDNA